MADKKHSTTPQQTSTTATHHIDYGQQQVVTFLQQLHGAASNLESIKYGSDASLFEQLWCQIGNADLATVYLTVLTGKLLLVESKILQMVNNSLQDMSDPAMAAAALDEKSITVQETVEHLKLGSHKYDDKHSLLTLRKMATKSKPKRMLIDADESSQQKDINIRASTTGALNPLAQLGKMDKLLLSPDQQLERASMMNSLLFVSLFYRFDFENASLLNLIDTWSRLRSQTQGGSDSLTEEVKECLCPPTEPLYKYLQLCCDFDSVEEEQAVLPPPLSRYDPLTLHVSYVYARMQALTRVPKVGDKLVDELVFLINQVRALPLEQPNVPKIKSILQFVQLLVPQIFVENVKKYEDLIAVLQHYYIAPHPLGLVVKETILMLKQEMKHRGSSMRKRFERTIRRVRQQDGSIVEQRRCVKILYNPTAQYASFLTDRFDLTNTFTDADIVQTKANLLLNMFHDVDKQHEATLINIPAETLAAKYREAAGLMENAEASNENVTPYFVQLAETIKANKGTGTPVVRCTAPKMPEMAIQLISLPQEEDILQNPRQKKSIPVSKTLDVVQELIKKAKEEKPDDEEKPSLDIAIAGGSGTFQHLIHSFQVLSSELDAMNVKVYCLPLGENNYLSSWLEKYDGWFARQVHYPLLSPINLLPNLRTPNTIKELEAIKIAALQKKNSLIKRGTLSRKSIIGGAPIKPLSKKEASTNIEYIPPDKFLTPHRFMRSLLTNYFTDATVAIPMQVYNVQCMNCEVIEVTENKQVKKEKTKKVTELLTLSFCQRVEIGVLAEMLQFQKQEKLEGQSFEEIQSNKNFKYAGIPVSFSYVPMTPTAELVRISEIAETPKIYQSITIRNTTSFNDKGELVAPSQPWLEVFSEEVGAAAKQKKKPARPQDLGSSYHAANLNIESTTAQPFSIVLDGELYGPFHKVLISAAKVQTTQKPFSVPIMTFNDIHLF